MNDADILEKNILCRENNKYKGPEEKTHFRFHTIVRSWCINAE